MSETKAAIKALAPFPSFTFVNISPAPRISQFNPGKLCNYVIDKITRIDAIPEFSTCIPSTGNVNDIYELLFPLASSETKDLSPSDKSDRAALTIKLRQNFMLMINSCASLALGNLKLFLLTGVANKRKGVSRKKKLDACFFKLNTKKGKGNVGVSCTALPYAKNYIIYFGIGEYNAATWSTQIGPASQVVPNLIPGQLYGFIMIAIGSAGEGEEANQQNCNAPFN